MSDLARAEWDFSKCPKDQLEYCRDYEFQRESEDFTNRVQRYRATLGNWGFAECMERFRHPERFEWPGRDEDSKAEWEFFYGSPSWYFEEFPRKAFLTIPPEKRKLLAAERRSQPSLDEMRFKEVQRLWSQFPQDDPDSGATRVPNTHTTVAAFCINWELSPDELAHRFKRWLAENRDNAVPIIERRGKGEISRWRKELKQLGTWRLLAKMGWTDAYLMTRKHLGRGLWCDRSEVWAREARAAKRLLSHTVKALD